MFEDLNAFILETDKLIAAIVSEDRKYDHENENTAADFKLFNIETPN